MPTYVATPLPPLNFNHTGKTWPRNIDNEDKNINSEKLNLIISNGITVFKKSNNNVVYPINLFPVRKTFVAPVLPEPISLISCFKNIFVNKNPNGIEPIVYDIKSIRTSSIFKF